MRRRTSHSAQLHSLTELNVTPLLDLAFVLLIIFMITTPLMENSLDLVVPTSATAVHSVNPSEVQTIAVDRNGVLKLNEAEQSPEALEDALRGLKLRFPDMGVVVRPHRDLPVQKFVAVMDILQRVGVSKVGLMTLPEAAPESP